VGNGKHRAKFKEEKDGATQKLKDTIRRLQSDVKKLKSEIATYEAAFQKNIQFLKGKTKDLSVKELIEGAQKNQNLTQIEDTKTVSLADLEKKWKCKSCNEGILRFVKIPRQDGVFYIRKCDHKKCSYATRLKKFDSDVEVY
jgi:Sec-independent protein translocase protein TatA